MFNFLALNAQIYEKQAEQWRALASAVEGGEGRQSKFLKLLGIKDKGKGKEKVEKGKGKGADVEAEERKRAAALARQFEEGVKHRHHRHGGLGL